MTKLLTIVMGLFLSLSGFADSGLVLNEHNTIVMNSRFDRNSTSIVAQKAIQLANKLPRGEALNLVIDSGGGSIQAGLELITNLNSLNRPINTICIWCASMAFQTIQGLNGKRIILPFGTMMSHKASGRFQGEFPGQLTNRLDYYLRRLEKMDQITVDRSNGKQTLENYKKLYENEYWCDGIDCVENGFSDATQTVVCDASLSGKETKEYAVPVQSFGSIYTAYVSVVKAKCPTVTGILEVAIKMDGQTFKAPTLELLKDTGINTHLLDTIKKEVNAHRVPMMYFEAE